MVEQVLRQLGIEVRSTSGENYLARCPWPDQHARADQHASFSVHKDDGLWICFAGCGSGNLEQLVARLGGTVAVSTPAVVDSLEFMARPESGPDRSDAVARADYELQDPTVTSSYLLHRGFTVETLLDWGVRYDAQLTAVVLPIHDQGGRLVGVVRRFVPPVSPVTARYQYTRGFQKSRVLFGLHRLDLTATTPVVLVEGPLDVMWLAQAGIKTGVALFGVHCSRVQERLLRSLRRPVLLALDNDVPGQQAVKSLTRRLPLTLVPPKFEGKDLQDLPTRQVDELVQSANYFWE